MPSLMMGALASKTGSFSVLLEACRKTYILACQELSSVWTSSRSRSGVSVAWIKTMDVLRNTEQICVAWEEEINIHVT